MAQHGRPLALSAESVLLVDPGGRTLFAKNPRADHAPASLVKLMTLYLAFESIEAGRVQSDDVVAISHHAASTDRYRMGLREGDRVPLHTVMEGVGIASANDAATALAEHVAGSEAAFVERMNAKAAAMGLTATRFANPHGLPHPNQRSNARDLALLTVRDCSRTIRTPARCSAGRTSCTADACTAATSPSSGTRGACRRSRRASRARPATTCPSLRGGAGGSS